jgi:hypothetical protein
MSTATEKVRQEMERFNAALPELMKALQGKWVIFKDGQVQSHHDDETSAYLKAVETYGLEGGFVIAEVREQKPVLLSAAVAFMLGSAA